MQGALFSKILHMSLIGCYSVVIVLLSRLLLLRLKCERKYVYYLWLAVFLNLSVPISVSGFFSLIPRQVTEFAVGDFAQGEEAEEETPYEESWYQDIHVFSMEGLKPAVRETLAANPALALRPTVEIKEKAGWKSILTNPQMQARILNTAEIIWLMGVLCFLACSLAAASCLAWRLSRGTRIGAEEREGIVEIEDLPSPFLWGFVRPIIYLPAGMGEEERRYIIAHETYHRERKDHLVKIVFFCVTVVHWFNPLAWLAYGLCCKDMEISCDEAVLSRSQKNIRKAYAQSILKFAARQNGFIITPLTFGEPSAKSRIRNVLKYRRRGAALSVIAILCVAGVAAGLLLRPAAEVAGDENGEEQAALQEPQRTDEGTENKLPMVEGNGQEVIRVGGEPYYISGQKLYSDGQKLYASLPDEDGSWDTYAYELDGSGFKQMTEGRIVGCDAETMELYLLQEEGENESLEPGLYILGDLDLVTLGTDVGRYLGIHGEYAYFERTQDGDLYVDRIWKGDGTKEENVLGQGISAQMFTDFAADDEYLLFSAGEVQGSAGTFYGEFYSYDSQPGVLKQEHLTDASRLALAGDYIYYQKFDNQGNGGNELYRAGRDLTEEEQVGSGLSYLRYDEQTETILAVKAGAPGEAGSLVRVNPDGSEERVLFDIEEALTGDAAPEEGLDWNMEDGDKIQFSQVSLLGDVIYVKAEQWGYREDAGAGWRDSLIGSAYLQIQSDGSVWQIWNPESLTRDSDEAAYLDNPLVGEPCQPEASGWNLAEIKDVRDDFSSTLDLPEDWDGAFLLGEVEGYKLYGSRDYSAMLIENGGTYVAGGVKYAEIRYPYGSNYMILPELMEFDYDGDGAEEAAICLNIKHGTGFYVDTLLMADRAADGQLYVYQFLPEDFEAQLSQRLSSDYSKEGLRAYVNGKPAGPAVPDDEQSGAYEQVSAGNQIRFVYGDCRVRINAELEFWSGDESRATPEYNGYYIQAEVVYEDGGQFSLKDFEVRETGLDQAIIDAVKSEKEGAAIRFQRIMYDLDSWDGGVLEAIAEIYPVGSESYDYANLELSWVQEGTGGYWRVLDIAWEK